MDKKCKDRLRRKVVRKVADFQKYNEIDNFINYAFSETSTAVTVDNVAVTDNDDNVTVVDDSNITVMDPTLSNEIHLSQNHIELNTHTNICISRQQNITTKLRKWAIEENVTHACVNKLLTILKDYHGDLPNDARTLLQTPRQIDVIKMNDGEYFHFGLVGHLQKYILKHKILHTDPIMLSFNIDGLPLFNNSTKHAWPILASVDNEHKGSPFMIGIWCGIGKPNIDLYLKDFVQELSLILQNGLEFEEKIYIVNIRAFICDAPARAYIKRITSHNGYYGCEKCIQKGVYLSRMTFPEIDAPLRTGTNFLRRDQENHHTGKSPLEDLNINMVDSFGLDYMHLVCLGVMRKLLHIWCFGSLQHRLGQNEKRLISTRINKLSKFLPSDFNRKLRNLLFVRQWKATEYRSFLLYIGPIALRNILHKIKYQHFMLLSSAIHI